MTPAEKRVVAPVYSDLYVEWASNKADFDTSKVWDALFDAERELASVMDAWQPIETAPKG